MEYLTTLLILLSIGYHNTDLHDSHGVEVCDSSPE